MITRQQIWLISDIIILLLLIIGSFYLTIYAGERGFFACDQSIVFDGAYRVLSGQIPYKDFVIPFGPIVFWIQAIFFKLFGINYFSYILCAAVVNVLSTICSIILVRLLFPACKFLSYIAGLLTGIWFFPPFGTPWAEQIAFFLSLISITIFLYVQVSNSSYNILLLSISGVLTCLSFLSKQNAGAFFSTIVSVNITILYRY